METQVAESGFNQAWERSDLETAVMIFQDETPESIRKKFDTYQWTVVLRSASSESKIKDIAWQNIETARLTFEKASEIFVDDSSNEKLKLLMLDTMCSSAKTSFNIHYCINLLGGEDERIIELLDRLSKSKGSFDDWERIFTGGHNRDVREIALDKMQEVEATFERWEEFNRKLFSSCRHHHMRRIFAEMKKRADTFRRKFAVYNAFKEEKALVAEILKDMEETADKLNELAWLYKQTGSKRIKNKILTVEVSFDDWMYVNQVADKDWLKGLSLKRMKELAKTFNHQAIIWCRDSSEQGKRKAVSNMIEMSISQAEAMLVCRRASGTSLEAKARQKLKQIVLA